MTSSPLRDEARQLLEAITPGDWGVEEHHPDVLAVVANPQAPTYEWVDVAMVPESPEDGITKTQMEHNAKFIAAAPRLIRALLAEVRQQGTQQSGELRVGDVIALEGRSVRVVGAPDGGFCRDHRDRIAVRNVATDRLSYLPEWRLLKATKAEVRQQRSGWLPLCPFCQQSLAYRGWTGVKANSRWECAACQKSVEIEPFIPSQERTALVPPLPEVDSTQRMVTPSDPLREPSK